MNTYLDAIEGAFGADVDYAQLVKTYGELRFAAGPERRYSAGECCGARKRLVTGSPDPKEVCTSFVVERQNLAMRTPRAPLTRLTNAFSKKIENHAYAVALHMMYSNFVRIHQGLRITPAMAAGVSDRLWEIGDIVALVETAESRKSTKRGLYKKRFRLTLVGFLAGRTNLNLGFEGAASNLVLVPQAIEALIKRPGRISQVGMGQHPSVVNHYAPTGHYNGLRHCCRRFRRCGFWC